jgi:hypothetical protein
MAQLAARLNSVANDPGCVETPQTEKRLEWLSQIERNRTAFKISRALKRGLEEKLFCRLRVLQRFYTAKTLACVKTQKFGRSQE